MKPNPIPLIAIGLAITLHTAAQISRDTAGQDQKFELLLKSGRILPPKNITSDNLNRFNREASRSSGKGFAILQFDHIPSIAQRARLKEAGIELLDYVPNYAYTVSFDGSLAVDILSQVNARAVLELSPQQKMEPALAKGDFPSWSVQVAGTVDVWISFPRTLSFEAVSAELKSRNFDIISTDYKNYRVLDLRVSVLRLNELASLPIVDWVESAPKQPQSLNNKSTVNSRANVLKSSIPGGRSLDGKDVVIGIGDDSDPLNHIDLNDRVINRAAIAGGNHGVHVQGITSGNGNVDERFAGAAPKSTIVTQAFAGILNYASVYVQDHGMVITNNSYGNIVDECFSFGSYSLTSRILDQQEIDMPNLQHVFAAGNSGAMTCGSYPTAFATVLGDYQSAKNVLTVGNTLETSDNRFNSSRGPVKDGRLKPEISAQGTFVWSTFPGNSYARNSGTSMASPAIAGGLALLYQRYRQLHSNANPKNGLMKALMCNGATDLGKPGPDYTFGFGWADLLRSVKMLEQNNYFDDSVANAGTNNHSITVPSNTAQLKVMLYWNDPAATVLSTHTLVNDLDLEVLDPLSNTTTPLILDTIPGNVGAAANPGVDHINNIEQVVIDNPMVGTYTLKVKGTAVTQNPRQEYFLVYDTIPVSTTLTYPIGGEHFVPGDSLYISWDAFGSAGNTFTVEYSTDNGSNWTTLSNNVADTLRQLKWFIPSVVTDVAKVRITRNTTGMVSTSEVFIILGQPTITLPSPQCEGYIHMDWTATAVTGATDYEVMMLRGEDFVSIGTTALTTYNIGGLAKDSTYYVTVRARLNGNPGRRALAVPRMPNSGDCSAGISDNDIVMQSILTPASSGRKSTVTELQNSVNLTVTVKNIDDVPLTVPLTFSYTINGGSPVTDPPVSPTITAGGTYDYIFLSPIDLSAIGTYTIAVTVTTPSDPVTANNTVTKTFKQLDNPVINLASTFLDNIESASTQSFTTGQMGLPGLDRYDFVNSTSNGRIRTFVNSGIAYSGSKALTLDADRFISSGNTDSLTGTFNLTSYTAFTDDIRLDFRYKNHGQASNAANNVWIRGSDQGSWISVYDLYANQNAADGSFKKSASIKLSDFLTANVQDYSSSFQVKWGQWGKILAADNESGAGYTFDDVRLYKVTDDMQMVSIDAPITNSCALTASTAVSISVHNSTNAVTATTVPVKYRIDGGLWVTESMPPIAANTTSSYTFTTFADLSAMGTHLLEVKVAYITDSYDENDTTSLTLINSPKISSFPYLEDFESSSGNWYTSGKNDSWEYGTPISSRINRAASGSKAWKTRVLGNYNDVEKSYLYSPCFDISGLTNPTLSLSIALDLEDCGSGLCDGAYVEYSNNGTTWTRLGGYGQGTNWYNKNYASNNLWSVQNYTRWHVATIPLPAGLNQMRLRFVMTSDAALNRDGVGIDDIHIYDNINGIYDGVTMGSPVTQTISGGTSWVDFTSGGKLVASIQPNNLNLGSTDVQCYINTSGERSVNYQYYHDRNITIKPTSVNLADSATVRFYFLDTETEALINATGCSPCSKPTMAAELGVSKYSDSNDGNENGTIADDNFGNWLFINAAYTKKVPFDKGYYAEFKVKDFSEFWLNNGGISQGQTLPVKLISFTARKSGIANVLAEWITSSEIDVNHYELEVARGNRDYQLNHFEKLGNISSHGNSTQDEHYSFVDAESNKSGARFYRLKIINNDGSFSYSPIRAVVFSVDADWLLYPNPSTGRFNLVFQENEGTEISAKVFDASGRLVKQYSPIGTGFVQKLNIDMEDDHFASGLYLLKVEAAGKQEVFRLVKE